MIALSHCVRYCLVGVSGLQGTTPVLPHKLVRPMSSWNVEGTDQFVQWFDGLEEDEQRAIFAAVEY
jgi:hypothetical protein